MGEEAATLKLSDDAGHSADPIAESADRAALRARVKALITEVSPPARVRELDEAETFDEALFERLGAAGLLGLGGPGELGAAGDVRDQVVVIEELAAGPTSMAVYTIVHYMVAHLVAVHGSPAQRNAVLGGLLEGRRKASFALSEPAGGTDVLRAMTTRAAPAPGGGWRLDGTKRWIGGAQRADDLVVLARTREAHGSGVDGITMFLLPGRLPGMRAKVLDTVAIRGLDTNEVIFDGVVVGEDAILGRLHQGFRQVLGTLNRERLACAAAALGIGCGAFEEALAYARERQAFGRPLGAFQVLQHRLVDGALELESARALLVRAAEVEAAGGRSDLLSSMAKLAASEVALRVTDDGMRLLGGSGMWRELPMQRWFRDARLYAFAPITNEMVRNYLGERLLHLPRSF